MTMENFKSELKNAIKCMMGASAEISFDVDTVRGVPTEVITISSLNGKNYGAGLQSLYSLHLRGMKIPDIVAMLTNITTDTQMIDTSNIVYRMVNAADNAELLKSVPHVLYYDMAILFVCVMEHHNSRGFLIISQNLMEENHLTIEQLVNLAQKNTFRKYPCKASLILFELLQNLMAKPDSSPDDFSEFAAQAYIMHNTPPLLRATCENYPCGSVAMLNTAFLAQIADDWGHSLILLPGSDEDFGIIPYLEDMDKSFINAQAKEVLSIGTQTILTHNVFLFNKDTRRIELFE